MYIVIHSFYHLHGVVLRVDSQSIVRGGYTQIGHLWEHPMNSQDHRGQVSVLKLVVEEINQATLEESTSLYELA
jgi:hypothetical protein